MQQILVYGDSLTWGIVPGTRRRFSFDERWPGVLEDKLNSAGARVRAIEDCLNGRRTVWEDPFRPGRRGLDALGQVIEKHSPLALVILMLGSNDFQFSHPYNNAWSAAQGVAALVNEIRRAPIEPGMPIPPVLVVCPPPVLPPRGLVAEKFAGAEYRCQGFAGALAEVAAALGCEFFDSAAIISSSRVDGVHSDADEHLALGRALAGFISLKFPEIGNPAAR